MTNIDYRRAFKIACDLLNGDVFYGVDTDKIFELMMQKDGVVSSRSYEEYILNHLQELDQGQYASNSKNSNKSEIPTSSIIDWNNCHTSEQLDSISTTKNDLALIRTWGLDEEIRCTMCTNSMKNDRGCDGSCAVNKDMYKAVMDAIEKRIQSTTKNNLAVDCISRTRAIERLKLNFPISQGANNSRDRHRYMQAQADLQAIRELPSVTPQESILDKIRAEIKRTRKMYVDMNDIDGLSVCDYVLSVIDKYKAETE